MSKQNTAVSQIIEMQKGHLQVIQDNMKMHKVDSLDWIKLREIEDYLQSSIQGHLPPYLPVEKQQIENAVLYALDDIARFGHEGINTATDYFTSTYNEQ